MVRIGIVGIGNMGAFHACNILDRKIENAVLTAVCDIDTAKSDKFDVPFFDNHMGLIESGFCDAVIVATPHYDHPKFGIDILNAGLHLLSEKPLGVYEKQITPLIKTAEKSDKVFAIMLNQRTDGIFRKMKQIAESGELGKILRLNWIVTNWYRDQNYYDSGDWRGTYSGEGGGVLLNQAVHNIDIWQWIMGVPNRITAVLGFGKYHDISVEDDATLLAEYESGATATFITTTGEKHGENRFEIVFEQGRLLAEDGKLWLFTDDEKQDITPTEIGTEHVGIIQNFVNAIETDEALISPGSDGLNAVKIINAAYLSAWQNRSIELPANAEEYFAQLKSRQIDGKKCKKLTDSSENFESRWKVKW